MSDRDIWVEQELSCKPLDSFKDVWMFLQDPPAWCSLCKDMKPHSEYVIRNMEVNKDTNNLLKTPHTFCHFNSNEENFTRHEAKKLPKTLVCHDMANGYHDDSLIDGTGNYDAYSFYNWAGIDIFCYFSHHFITIPPLGWINIGHAHGVKVIGTVITEWAEGIAIWAQVLASDLEMKNFASALVAIAKTLKFDGWLLNVENKVMQPDKLLEFVKLLHTMLHEELTDPVLIWYDSVTIDGHLSWQNKLNNKNKAFFDACDGFFTNYSWSTNDIEDSAVAAGDRVLDVFIGVDVWGRNFYGGGHFNLQEAIKVVHANGCSVAIFAPAWTHEAISANDDINDPNTIITSESLNKFEQFLLRDRALWDSIWPFLNTKLPSTLPFQTSFCRGQGKKRRLYGEALCPMPWYNLRHMQYQLNAAHGPHGYLLSCGANVVSSKHPVQSEKGNEKPLVAYQSVESRSDSDVPCHQMPQADSLSDINEQDQKESLEGQEPTTLKRKIKNSFKHIFEFQRKSRKTEEVNNAEWTEAQTSNAQINDAQSTDIQTRDAQPTVSHLTEAQPTDAQPLVVQTTYTQPTDAQPLVVQTTYTQPTDTRTTDAQPTDTRTTDTQKTDAQTTESEVNSLRSTGQSMVQMPVNINLGQRNPKARFSLTYVPEELDCLELFLEDSFTGGSCIKINPSDQRNKEHRSIRLFFCDIYCESTLLACVVTKNMIGFEGQSLNIKLFIKDAEQKDTCVTLVGRSMPRSCNVDQSTSVAVNTYPINLQEEFKDLQKYILLNEPGFYIPTENSYGWVVRYYRVRLPGCRVTSINCRTGSAEGPILLGHFGLCAQIEEPKDNDEVEHNITSEHSMTRVD